MQIKQLRSKQPGAFYRSWRSHQSNFTKGWREASEEDSGSAPWHFSNQIGGQHVHGEFAWKYESSGYKLRMFRGDKVEKLLKFLDHGWIDNSTRLITIDFGLYCAAERMFTTVQVSSLNFWPPCLVF